MKLSSLRSGRDGCLVVVSRTLRRAVLATEVAYTLQAALDEWSSAEPALRKISKQLNAGERADAFDLDPSKLAAPLPRAPGWLDASAYVNHVELVRRARGAEMPASFWTDPLMYQGGSDVMLGARDPIAVASESQGIDFEGEVAVFLDDVPMGCTRDEAATHIQLVSIVNDISLRNLIPNELAKGFGFLHGKPPTAFAPVAVTPDELGESWDGAVLHRPLVVHRNDELFGQPDAGIDMTFDFPTLIAHAAKTRPLTAGTILGSGTVSNRNRSTGSCCIAERRMLEALEMGKPKTRFLSFGERVRIDMRDATTGASIFGAIDQTVVRA